MRPEVNGRNTRRVRANLRIQPNQRSEYLALLSELYFPRLIHLPWKERLLPDVPAGGAILKMEFLQPSQNDDNQVILLLIVSKRGKTRMLWYEWNSTMTLREAQMKPTAQSSPQEEQLPLLLIPLKAFTAFIVVCEKCITLYKDILTGTPSRYVQHLDRVKDPEEMGSSGRQPVWVQWARPMRRITDTHTVDVDEIYLCREDGIVQYLTVNHVDDHMIDTTHNPGRLGTNVNTAFAVVDVGPNTVDLLAAGGDMAEGGLWRSSPRENLEHLRSIPHWTPLNHFISCSASAEPSSAAESVTNANHSLRTQQRIFGCTGRGRHGAITELRYGHEAPEGLGSLDLPEEVSREVLDLWVFHGFYGEAGRQHKEEERGNDTTYILIACPTRTFLLRVPLKQDPQNVPEALTVDLGLNYNARTIAAGYTSRGLIQVTESSIRATALSVRQEEALKMEQQDDVKLNKDLMDSESRARYCFNFEDSRVVKACLYDTGEKTFILAAVQQGEEFYLQLGHLNASYEPTTSISPHFQPSCLLLRSVGSRLLAFVGTLEKKLHVFDVDSNGHSFEAISHYDFQDAFAICDSLAIITRSNNDNEHLRYIVVCGLRNGSLQTLHLETDFLCERPPSSPVKIRTDFRSQT